MIDENLPYWIAFTKITNIGPIRLTKIMKGFKSGKVAWTAKAADFISMGIENSAVTAIMDEKKFISPDKECEILIQEKVSVLSLFDSNYPRLLKEIPNPPPLLYYRGTIKSYELALGVVGTRKVSSYGKMIAHDLSYTLAQRGLAIVSGLALGIDAIAHHAALEAKGVTLAVLGGGLDEYNIYPVANRALAHTIIESGGALISEYPCGTQSLKTHFPQRNRIISGLSLGTLVIEAPEKSGALITTKFALEQNRDIFAVPQNIYNENAKGVNNLIKMGAKLVTSAEDIIEELNIETAVNFKKTSGDIVFAPDEELLMSLLAKEPMHIDSIIRESKISAAKANSLLSMLEIKGAIKNAGGGMYCKI